MKILCPNCGMEIYPILTPLNKPVYSCVCGYSTPLEVVIKTDTAQEADSFCKGTSLIKGGLLNVNDSNDQKIN